MKSSWFSTGSGVMDRNKYRDSVTSETVQTVNKHKSETGKAIFAAQSEPACVLIYILLLLFVLFVFREVWIFGKMQTNGREICSKRYFFPSRRSGSYSPSSAALSTRTSLPLPVVLVKQTTTQPNGFGEKMFTS